MRNNSDGEDGKPVARHARGADISLNDLYMHYAGRGGKVDVLRGVSLEVSAGERIAVTGPSGCGKTTVLLLLSALERPSAGTITVDGADINALDADAVADWRRDRLGIVFQSFHLVASLSALDNVSLPLEIAGHPQAKQRAREALARVGLQPRERHYPSELSGGEQQRVAIARAIVHQPALILADEPTGNLDDDTGASVSAALFELVAESGATFVLVTHDESLTQHCDRTLRLQEGRVEDVTRAAIT